MVPDKPLRTVSTSSVSHHAHQGPGAVHLAIAEVGRHGLARDFVDLGTLNLGGMQLEGRMSRDPLEVLVQGKKLVFGLPGFCFILWNNVLTPQCSAAFLVKS